MGDAETVATRDGLVAFLDGRAGDLLQHPSRYEGTEYPDILRGFAAHFAKLPDPLPPGASVWQLFALAAAEVERGL